MTPRERGIRAGHREWWYIGEHQIVLYWEPYGKAGPKGFTLPATAFTVDINYHPGGGTNNRWRFDTLEQADKHIESLTDQLAVEVAKKAFGLH